MVVQLSGVQRNRPVLHFRALKPNLLPQHLQLRSLFGSEDFFLPLTISLALLPSYSLTIKGQSCSSKTILAQSTASTSSFATTLFVKNLLIGKLLPNTSLQTSSWLTVSPNLLLVLNSRNLLKNSVSLKKCLLSGHIVIHLAHICLTLRALLLFNITFFPDLFPYIRLDCIFLCATQFSPQFRATKTEVSIRCFLYILFIVWHVPSHNCSRYIQIY